MSNENNDSQNNAQQIPDGAILCPVLAGDNVTSQITNITNDIALGMGLIQQGKNIFAINSGKLQYFKPNKFRIICNYKRYPPRIDENVIGVVVDKNVDNYYVDIGSSDNAILPTLAFQGASRRNRPELKIGTIVFCRVVNSFRDLPVELSCIELTGPKKDWSTKETIYGELVDGLIFQCSPLYCSVLKNPNCCIIQELAKHDGFEIAIGSNGVVWLNSTNIKYSIFLRNCILIGEKIGNDKASLCAMIDEAKKTL